MAFGDEDYFIGQRREIKDQGSSEEKEACGLVVDKVLEAKDQRSSRNQYLMRRKK